MEWVISCSALGKGQVVQCSATHGGRSSCFIHICQNRQVRQLLTVTKDEHFFEPWLKNYTWVVYDRDGNVMYCKIFKKAKKSNGSTRAEIFRILRSFVLLVFSQEQQMTNLCLHAICPYGHGTHVHGSGTHTWAQDLQFAGCVSPELTTALFTCSTGSEAKGQM